MCVMTNQHCPCLHMHHFEMSTQLTQVTSHGTLKHISVTKAKNCQVRVNDNNPSKDVMIALDCLCLSNFSKRLVLTFKVSK